MVRTRRDRPGEKSGAGVDVFVRNNFWDVGLSALSETSERSWVTMHTTNGPILIGTWYRPPDEAREELQSLAREIEQFSLGHIGVFVFCPALVTIFLWGQHGCGTGSSRHMRERGSEANC